MARPSKLTAEVSERICRAIRAGNYPATAARAAGIAESTFYRWMEEGRSAESGKYRDFHEAVKRAEAEGEARAVVLISKAMAKDWRAAMALLERRHPERWRRRERLEHAIAEERPILDLSLLSEEELQTLEGIGARLTEPE